MTAFEQTAHLADVPIDLEVELGRKMMTLDAVLALTKGSVIRMPHSAGENIDILAGITAPIIYYLVFVRKSVGRIGLLVWNIFGLASLFNIVTIAVLSAPFPIQRLALDQPNIAVLYFPFNWLPSVIVTIVLFSHLAAIRKLLVHANL